MASKIHILASVISLGLLIEYGTGCPTELDSEACTSVKEDAGKLLKSLCKSVGFVSACVFEGEGENFGLLVHACQERPGQKECKSLKECGDDLDELAKCSASNIIPTDNAYMAVQSMCKDNSMDGCASCKVLDQMPSVAKASHVKAKCSSPLGTMSDLCLMMGEMEVPACKDFVAWCKENKSKICLSMGSMENEDSEMSTEGHGHHMMEDTGSEGQSDEASDHAHHQHTMPDIMDSEARTASATSGTCYDNSGQTHCKPFKHPEEEIQKDIQDICVTKGKSMPWMVGCHFHTSCKSQGKHDGYCDSFVLLATLCKDMPGMSGCSRYNSLCSMGSKVEQCNMGPIPKAPMTMATQNAIISACTDHTMPACYQCRRSGAVCADPMATMAELCHTMPDMPFCGVFTMFCSAINNEFRDLCVADDNNYLPPMRMYFHQSLRELILLKNWIPDDGVTYGFSVLVIILMAVLTQFLKTVRMSIETRWHRNFLASSPCKICPVNGSCETSNCTEDCGTYSQTSNNCNAPKRVFMSIPQARRNAIRSLFTAITTALEYALMLIAMTFNIGLFCAVVGGFMLGTFLFGHVVEHGHQPKPLADQASWHMDDPRRGVAYNSVEGACCGGPV